MAQEFYAHSVEGKPVSEWQKLDEHLLNVADLAKKFADVFGSGDWAYLAGLWHDVGKYSNEFRQMLGTATGIDAHIETKHGRVDHSTAGAQHAFKLLKPNRMEGKGKMLSYIIAGHHSGLPNGKSNNQSCLVERLKKSIHDFSACPSRILDSKEINEPPFAADIKRIGFQLSFFIRMLYSSLVDADFLDTEKFMDRATHEKRKGYPPLSELSIKLTTALNHLTASAPDTPVNKERALILRDCLKAAERPPCLFSLTVPTGGGKTLSSMAFAMKHALSNSMNRIIYVIPYTSIIEQTAKIFRDIFGGDAVVEHHSNFDPAEEDHRSRLSSENWDAPIIVTTNVQFFEALFASRSSRCRRIHNITNSVVILDEAQMLPVHLLRPCLEAIKELTSVYKTTIVLCTATQPALSTTDTFKNGLDGVREIVPDPVRLYNAFRRIQITKLPVLSDTELSKRITAFNQVLCIVNTRKHARKLYEQIDVNCKANFHLSASMCPAHRTKKISEIKNLLKEGKPCRVISTQLIEAGVDIDFPVVFRAAAGIDSIAQAAGRCNREGKLPDKGQVFTFYPENGLPRGHFRQTAEVAETVMRHHDDILSPSAIESYFRDLYWTKGEKQLDAKEILEDLKEDAGRLNFPFKEIDKKFMMIEENMESIIIPWNEKAENIIKGLRYAEYATSLARKAQRFAVQVHPRVLISLVNVGSVEIVREQYYVLVNMDLYRDDVGLCPDDPTFHEVERLMV